MPNLSANPLVLGAFSFFLAPGQAVMPVGVSTGLLPLGIQQPGSEQSGSRISMLLDDAAALASRTVVFKVQDGISAEVHDGTLESSEPLLQPVVAHLYGVEVERFFTQDFEELEDLRLEAISGGAWPIPQDLNLYFRIVATDEAQALWYIADLSRLPGVQVSYQQPGPVEPPQDLFPNTPNWTAAQQYYQEPGPGTNQWTVAGVLGARGRNIRITDCEFDWVLDHEDIGLDSSHLVGGTPIGAFADHGTAALGQLYAQDNDYGMTGGVPDANMFFSTEYATTFGYNPTQSIVNAVLESEAGDVVLLEMQTTGPTGSFVPEEWTPASFAIIQLATALGVHVVEAGGNGGMDLDSSSFFHYFDTAVQDSQAVIVGAGSANSEHTKLAFTSRGSRVDCQAWGVDVFSTGYGWLWEYGTDDLQDYTYGFSGTSAASPIVASAIAATLGAMRAHGMLLPSPLAMREALRNTGTPQLASDVLSGRIGPMPDLEALFAWFDIPTGLRHAPRVGIGESLNVFMKGTPGETWELFLSTRTVIKYLPFGVKLLADSTLALVASGTFNAAGNAIFAAAIPNITALQGREVFTQALFSRLTTPEFSNGGMLRIY